MQPLADRLRPTALEHIAGQQHLIGKNGLLRRLIESGNIPNMIFFGPPGVGKTTLAGIIASLTNRTLYKLNGTSASTSDVKAIVDELDTFLTPNGALVYLDEIQYFNKKQQQSLLEYMENGKITLIASTTENPHFYIYPALLSRSVVFEFLPLKEEDVEGMLLRGIAELEKTLQITIEAQPDVVAHLAHASGGDVRRSLNALEVLTLSATGTKTKKLTLADAQLVTQKSAVKYDRDGDSHFDILSAFQKSVRGSDPDAAVYYLARLLTAGDLPSACRRILVIAAEDVGLAHPQAISIVKSCVDSALQLGLPEARIPLAEAVLFLATAPKSNSAICAIDAATQAITEGDTGEIPLYLKDSHYQGAAKLGRGTGYQYPHAFPKNYVKQQYLPDKIKGSTFYEYGDNKLEQLSKKYWDEIKK